MQTYAVTHKLQVVDRPPKRFKELQFGIQYDIAWYYRCALLILSPRSNQDIVNQAVLEVSNKQLYDVRTNIKSPIANGALDPKLVRKLDLNNVGVY
jgi:DNA-directed RNA polymerase III subunit RPC1